MKKITDTRKDEGHFDKLKSDLLNKKYPSTPSPVCIEGGYTKGKWVVRDCEIIGEYCSNKSICEMTGNFMDESEKKANAQRIVKAVNYFDALKENLERILYRIEESNLQGNFPSAYQRAKAILNNINNQ